MSIAPPTPPGSPIPVSTEAAGELQDVWAHAIATAGAGGEVTVTMTEEQLTSYADIKLADRPEAPIKDLQIYLRDGQILLYGNATVRGVTSSAQLVAEATPNADGRVDVKIVQGHIGGLPVPESMLRSLTTLIDDTLNSAFKSEDKALKVTGITIADGEMVVTGTLGE